MQIDVGVAEVGDGRAVQPRQGRVDAQAARLHLLQQLAHVGRFHEATRARDEKPGARGVAPGLWVLYGQRASRQQVADHVAGDVGEAEVAAAEAIGQPLVVDAEQVQDGGVQVVDVDRVRGDVVAEVVGRAVGDAAA